MRRLLLGVVFIVWSVLMVGVGILVSDSGAGNPPTVPTANGVRTRTALYQQITNSFRAVERKDIEAILKDFADEAPRFSDRNYPRPYMQGKEEIRRGLEWGLAGVDEFNFLERNYCETPDGQLAFIELYTPHVVGGGMMRLDEGQVFRFMSRDMKFIDVRSYGERGPHGIGQLVLLWNRLSGSGR